VWWLSEKEKNKIGLWGVQKQNADGLILVCHLAGLFCPPGDDVWQPCLSVVLGISARERERESWEL